MEVWLEGFIGFFLWICFCFSNTYEYVNTDIIVNILHQAVVYKPD